MAKPLEIELVQDANQARTLEKRGFTPIGFSIGQDMIIPEGLVFDDGEFFPDPGFVQNTAQDSYASGYGTKATPNFMVMNSHVSPHSALVIANLSGRTAPNNTRVGNVTRAVDLHWLTGIYPTSDTAVPELVLLRQYLEEVHIGNTMLDWLNAIELWGKKLSTV